MGTLNLNLDLFQPPKQNSVVLMRLVLKKLYSFFVNKHCENVYFLIT